MRHLWTTGLALALLLLTRAAAAFCGFYVSGADARLTARASSVVLLRDGTLTVLAMQNTYEGPPEDFALVVPVPVVLQKENVRTLPRAVFAKVEQMGSPRLVEYWEQDPCAQPPRHFRPSAAKGAPAGVARAAVAAEEAPPPAVKIEAQFDVDEYQIVILSSTDAGALDVWLRQNGYKIPAGAEAHFRPYIEAGMKFFVAKVDPKKLTFKDGRALLSPLRVHYEDTQFRLPIRLGLINADGPQDLIVSILAKSTRFEVANRPNVPIPTNLDVADPVRSSFSSFYAGLFDATLAKHPGAVVTEYSWAAGSCDPCPGPTLTGEDLASLGRDLVAPRNFNVWVNAEYGPVSTAIAAAVRASPAARSCASAATPPPDPNTRIELRIEVGADGKIASARALPAGSPDPNGLRSCLAESFVGLAVSNVQSDGAQVSLFFNADQGDMYSWVLTRLHARYDPTAPGEDLVFKTAAAISGGRELRSSWRAPSASEEALPTEPVSAPTNTFQARYAIRHRWTGPIACENPIRGRWGGPPSGRWPATEAARDLAFVKRDVALPSFLPRGLPAFAAMPALGAAPPDPTTPRPPPPAPWPSTSARPAPSGSASAPAAATKPEEATGCACGLGRSSDAPAGFTLLLGLAAGAAAARRRR